MVFLERGSNISFTGTTTTTNIWNKQTRFLQEPHTNTVFLRINRFCALHYTSERLSHCSLTVWWRHASDDDCYWGDGGKLFCRPTVLYRLAIWFDFAQTTPAYLIGAHVRLSVALEILRRSASFAQLCRCRAHAPAPSEQSLRRAEAPLERSSSDGWRWGAIRINKRLEHLALSWATGSTWCWSVADGRRLESRQPAIRESQRIVGDVVVRYNGIVY